MTKRQETIRQLGKALESIGDSDYDEISSMLGDLRNLIFDRDRIHSGDGL